MSKTKKLLIALMLLIAVLLLPNLVNAATSMDLQKNVYSMDGSMKFTFTGITIDTTHEYEYGITKTSAAEVETWYEVTESTVNSVTANIMTGTKQMRDVVNAVDKGYITIKDKTTGNTIIEHWEVDLKIPFLMVTNYEVITNGKKLDSDGNNMNVPLRNAGNSEAYYKYEKITDQNLINKYKEIKENGGEYTDLESLMKQTAPTSGYSTWDYWNGHGSDGRNGFGYVSRTIEAPDIGLYYLWVYFSGESIKNLYGCVIVDNLQPDIALESISLPATQTVKLGETLTLSPTFNPITATNKIVTWESSDEEIATVDNAGKITTKKVGSTIIKATSQDGNKIATCTVTVTEEAKVDTTSYISFPFIIFNGKSSVDLKSGVNLENYKMYYQFVEISDEVYNKLEDLKAKYNNKEITYEEYFVQYNETVTKYNDNNWIETEDGSFEQDLTKFTGTKKFALWIKLEMEDKTVYEAQIYKMDGSGTATNEPTEQDKLPITDKDTTVANKNLPNTGKVLLIWIIGIVAVAGIVAHVRYKKLYM